jgi:hypothetical protein
MYMTSKMFALGVERQGLQTMGAYGLFTTIVLGIIKRYWGSSKTVQDSVKTMEKISKGMRSYTYELGKQQQKAYKVGQGGSKRRI